MAAIKYYRAPVLDEDTDCVLPEEHEFWEEPLEAEGDATAASTVFVASLLVDAQALGEAAGKAYSGLGRVEVRKVVFREA